MFPNEKSENIEVEGNNYRKGNVDRRQQVGAKPKLWLWCDFVGGG